jgi:dTDP-4-dehydrorhamnose reductase
MKKVLILGSKGTLGQALSSEFGGGDYEVMTFDKDTLDVSSPDAPEKIEALKPDIIINSIAYNAVAKMENDEKEREIAIFLNSKLPGILAAVAKKIDAVFIHYSTSYVFDGKKREGYIETDTPNPIDLYGKSKADGEKAVEDVGGKYYIIRLSRLFGERGVSEMSKRTFVEIMQAEIEKPELEVGDTEISSMTYAPDLAKLTKYVVENNLAYGVYHGSNEGMGTWYDWAKEIFKDMGKGPKVIPAKHTLTQGVEHPQYSGLINTKLPPQRSWQGALKEFLQK